ncbi:MULTISPECIES: hypothetical protein [unclassified Rhizobacter]|uniref:hypothetical protein n=1 Tax=unclassified Rhizobacter TaxID=2640088 RepID=UPI000A41542A|nr:MULTISPECIES: hypothetical protein [unclassified Rhizobacter]
MAITFEHVSADIQRDPAAESTPAPAAPAAQPDDLREPLQQWLRLRDERLARLCAD